MILHRNVQLKSRSPPPPPLNFSSSSISSSFSLQACQYLLRIVPVVTFHPYNTHTHTQTMHINKHTQRKQQTPNSHKYISKQVLLGEHKSAVVFLPALLGNHDRKIDRPIEQPTDRQTDIRGNRKVTL